MIDVIVAEKRCPRCFKWSRNFSPDERNRDGLASRCRPCGAELTRRYSKRPGIKEKLRVKKTEWSRQNRKWHNEYERDQYRNGYRHPNYPEKQRARRILRDQLIQGTIIKPTECELCHVTNPVRADGRSALHGHHHKGYDNPIQVLWVCPRCHHAVHSKLTEGG